MAVTAAQRSEPETSTSDAVLRTAGLSKRYGSLLALDRVDIEVRRGTVYGFLGPNGAGKTTAISLILGLMTPTEGRIEVFGLDTRVHRADALQRTGAVLEGQPYYPLLSARDNLRVWGALYPSVADERIDAVLDLVGLGARAGDAVRKYSQGMKQRLGLAGALLHDPELLILDEPTNGLDPAGIREFRDLFKQLARQGKTVFVSSHILREVELICDEVSILKQGKLLMQGPVGELTSRGGGLELRVTDPARAVEVLQGIDGVASVTLDGDRLFVETSRERAWELSRALAEQQVYLHELRPREASLEDFFLEVTAEDADR